MDDHSEGEPFGKTRAISKPAISKLDWPTPEMLAAAHRARGLYLRELVVALVRRLKSMAAGPVLVAKPARVPISNRR